MENNTKRQQNTIIIMKKKNTTKKDTDKNKNSWKRCNQNYLLYVCDLNHINYCTFCLGFAGKQHTQHRRGKWVYKFFKNSLMLCANRTKILRDKQNFKIISLILSI